MEKKYTLKEISQIVVALATVYNTRKRMIKDVPLNHQKGAGRPPVVHDAIKYKVSQRIRRSNGAITLHDIHAKILSSGGTLPFELCVDAQKNLNTNKVSRQLYQCLVKLTGLNAFYGPRKISILDGSMRFSQMKLHFGFQEVV